MKSATCIFALFLGMCAFASCESDNESTGGHEIRDIIYEVNVFPKEETEYRVNAGDTLEIEAENPFVVIVMYAPNLDKKMTGSDLYEPLDREGAQFLNVVPTEEYSYEKYCEAHHGFAAQEAQLEWLKVIHQDEKRLTVVIDAAPEGDAAALTVATSSYYYASSLGTRYWPFVRSKNNGLTFHLLR